jgi:short-subunit dehydrogenase
MELKGTHVLITGASRGIGAAMARAFAGKGATVSLTARSGDTIKAMADELGGHAFVTDLFDPDQVDALVPRVEHEAGPIDVLVSNAGLETTTFFHEINTETIRDVTRLNLEAPMVLARQVLPGMLERNRGHLVFLSSLAGQTGFPGLAVYCGTKAGISNFASALRMELRDTAIKTTVVAPGPVDTDMWDNLERTEDVFGPILKRFDQLRLLRKKTPGYIADQTVLAVEKERRHVRTPKRLMSNFVVREIPGRLTEAALTGVSVGPKRD